MNMLHCILIIGEREVLDDSLVPYVNVYNIMDMKVQVMLYMLP